LDSVCNPAVGFLLDLDLILNPFWEVDLEYQSINMGRIWIGLTIHKNCIQPKPWGKSEYAKLSSLATMTDIFLIYLLM
jgi:hypothetical protein